MTATPPLAACMVYVELNPIRVGIAGSPEKSDFISIQSHAWDAKLADEVSTADAKDVRTEHGQRAFRTYLEGLHDPTCRR